MRAGVVIILLTGASLTQVHAQAPAPTRAPAGPAAPTVPSPPTAPGTKSEPQKVERVEVKDSAQRYDARREDTATKIVVTAEEIAKFGDTEVAEVLKRQPGISVQGSQVQMRGLGGGYLQFLIDGQRPPPGWTLDQLPLSQVEKIEIIRAATADMSTASIAGTINIVLKKVVTKSNREWRAGYRQGSGYRLATTSFLRSDRIDDFSYSVNTELFKNRIDFPGTNEQSIYDPGGKLTNLYFTSGAFPGSNERVIVTPRLQWALGGGDTLAWNSSLSWVRGSFNPVYVGQQRVGTPLPVISGNGNTTRDRAIVKTDLNWVFTLTGGTKVDFKAAASGLRLDTEEHESGFGATGALTQDRLSDLLKNNREFTQSGKVSIPILEGHALVTGWELGLERVKEHETRRDLPTTLNSLFVVDTDARTEVRRLAAFAQDEWNILENWSTYAGLRYEQVGTEVRVESGAQGHNRYSVWSPLFQTLWKFPADSSRQLRLALTRTYKAPDAIDLSPRVQSRSNNNSAIDPDYSGNPSLKPELATGVDMAIEKFWDPGGSISLSLSWRRIRDLMRNSVRLVGDRWTNSQINDGDAQVATLEFDTKFALPTVWTDAPPIDIRFNTGVYRSRVANVPGPNNRLASQTPMKATLGLDYRMKGGEFVAGGSIGYRGGTDLRTSLNEYSVLKARRDLEFYGVWKMSPKNTLRLTAADLLHEPNVDDKRYVDDTGTRRQVNIGQARMHLRVNLEMKF